MDEPEPVMTDVPPDPPDDERQERGAATLVAEHVDVTYRVYEDRRPTLRQIVASRFKPRAYRPIHAVKDVSFTAYAGEAIGVIGTNGSGKSTLMRALSGLMPVTGGKVWARGEPALLGVGAALQPSLSGRRNIMLGGLALGMSKDEIADKYADIVKFSGLEDAIDLPLKTYSSGMKARLHFALATSITPEVLIIDEALSVGDKTFRQRSQERIDELRDSAGTVFLVSHSMGSIKKTCQRALWLDQGVLKADGPAEDVVAQYADSSDD
jgi:teichoic acid transport system ATP-binding protein